MVVPEVGALVEVVVSGRVAEVSDGAFSVQVPPDRLLRADGYRVWFPARTMFVTVAPPLPARSQVALLACGDAAQVSGTVAPGDIRSCPRCCESKTVRHVTTVEWPTEAASKARCAELPG